MTQPKPVTLSFVENFILSGSAAVVSKTAVAPIERIKLLIQSQNEMIKYGRLSEPYKGIIDCSIKTFKTEGFLAFWRSNFVNCVRYFPSQALNFAFKDHIKFFFKTPPSDSHARKLAINVFSGGAAGALSSCFVYSLDYARTRLALDAKVVHQDGKGGPERQFSGVIDVYKKTFKSDGVQGLYKGFVISLVGMIVYRGFYFGLYDSLKPIILSDNAGVGTTFMLSYVVTVTSNLIAYPLDTIRRRMIATTGGIAPYKGSFDCAVQIVSKEGPMTLMKGAGANILRNIAGAGVLVGFDKSKELYVRWQMGEL